jgi:rubredoxin-NAD+ reductase
MGTVFAFFQEKNRKKWRLKLFLGGILLKKERNMKYVCEICGYEYDEEKGDTDNGIAAGTKWADLPADWVCPLCGVGKEHFSKRENA